MPAREERKLTIKSIMGANPDIEVILKSEGKKMDLFSLVGIANGFKPGEKDGRAWVRLTGDFEATNLQTGEIVKSAQCILPDFLSTPIANALSRPNSENVQFAVKIGVKYDKESVTKYVYVAESLMPVSDNAPLEVLKKSIVALLPSPKKGAAK